MGDEKLHSIVEDFEKRVVQITDGNGRTKGSGIIFRAGNRLFVQTCYHVISDLIAFSITREEPDINELIVTKYARSCSLQDKAICELSLTNPNQAKVICKKDYSWLLVHIHVGRKMQTGLIEYHHEEHSYVLHVFADSNIRERSTIKLSFPSANQQYEYSVKDLCYCSHTGCRLLFLENNHVPQATKDMFNLLNRAGEHLREPSVVIISHPRGGKRTKTDGRVMGTNTVSGELPVSECVRFKRDTIHTCISRHRVQLVQNKLHFELSSESFHHSQEIPLEFLQGLNGKEHLLCTNEKKTSFLKLKKDKFKYVEMYRETRVKSLSLEVHTPDNRDFKKFRNENTKYFYNMDETDKKFTAFLADTSGKSLYRDNKNKCKIARHPVYILHNAPTECGSSGGAVLIIGKYNGEYKALLAMHCGKVNNNRTGIAYISCLQN